MHHLETLKICFEFSILNRQVERQLMHTPIIAPITLLNHCFYFYGVSNYSKALVHRIIAPPGHLKEFNIDFFNHLRFLIPHSPAIYYRSTEPQVL